MTMVQNFRKREKRHAMEHYDLLVIGGDAAGMSAASQARRVSESISIGVFDRGEFVSYAACGMPYFIAKEISEYKQLLAIDPDSFAIKKNIHIHSGSEVVSVDTDAKTVNVKFKDKTETFSFNKLVIATGARAVLPPIEGITEGNIFQLRSLRDGITIRDYLDRESPRKGIIIGGGFIGLEMAEALRKRGIETVMLEKLDTVATSMSPEIRELVVKELSSNGVSLNTGIGIKNISYNSKRSIVHTDRGDMDADFIIVSAGIRPNTEFINGTKLSLFRTGAIIVDEMSRTSIPGIFAAGDCATVKHLVTGKDVYMPLGSTANKQGRVAGLQAAGITSEVFRGITGSQFVKIFDLELGKTGLNAHDAEVEGIEAESATVPWHSRANYYPGSVEILVTLTVDKKTGKVIGGEVAGKDGAALRTNVIAAAVSGGMHINDLAYMDFGYAPPFSPVWDPVAAAAQRLLKR